MIKNTQYKTSALGIIGKSYIKYDRLMQITNSAFVGSDADECTIIIDLYSVLKNLYSSVYDMNLDKNPTDIAAGIINIVAHYRKFYWTRYRVKTKFWLIYSQCLPKYSVMMYPEYNNGFASSLKVRNEVSENLIFNLNLIDQISKYISDVAFINTKYEPSTAIYYMATEGLLDTKNPVIVLTKDEITMQVASLDNFIIFRPRKTQDDESYFIKGDGLFEHFYKDNNVKLDIATAAISPSLYSLFISMSRSGDRNLKALLTVPNTTKAILSVISINSGYNKYISDIPTFISLINDQNAKFKLMHEFCYERFKALDMRYNAGLLANDSVEKIKFREPANLYDPNGIHEIVNKYFNGVEINLDNL